MKYASDAGLTSTTQARQTLKVALNRRKLRYAAGTIRATGFGRGAVKNIAAAAASTCLLARCSLQPDAGTPGYHATKARQVTLDSGPVRGGGSAGITEILGIPYAASPVGVLRWMSPRAVAPWPSTFSATNSGSACGQKSDLSVFASPSTAEYCLYRNVYIDKNVDPSNSGVSVAHPALDGAEYAFAYHGVLDLQFALRWLEEKKFAVFGVNPHDVTIVVKWSGGARVLTSVVSAQLKGLFRHAMSISGSAVMLKCPAFGAPRPLNSAEEVGRQFAVRGR